MQPWSVTECPTVTWSASTVGCWALKTWTTQLSWMLVCGADADGVHVAAHHRVHPHAGVVAQLDVADDLRGGVDVDALAQPRTDAFVGTKHALSRKPSVYARPSAAKHRGRSA